jgi:DNA polymerase-3 subunit delta'
MVVAGSLGQPAGVADCLALQSSLHLKPVLASRRLGVICSAESLSLPAANSLLKVTEEPPDGVFLLFLAERDNLIPTIRSRVWTLNFHRPAGSVNEPEFPPSTPLEWAAWLERTKKSSLDELVSLVDLWASSLGGRGEWSKSAALQNVMYLSRHRHMPVSMVQDALYAILWEGMHGGQIFGDLREA